jgi:hypothetical protein
MVMLVTGKEPKKKPDAETVIASSPPAAAPHVNAAAVTASPNALPNTPASVDNSELIRQVAVLAEQLEAFRKRDAEREKRDAEREKVIKDLQAAVGGKEVGEIDALIVPNKFHKGTVAAAEEGLQSIRHEMRALITHVTVVTSAVEEIRGVTDMHAADMRKLKKHTKLKDTSVS